MNTISKQKFLVAILTSKMPYLKECYESIANQIHTSIDYDIIIITNSLNKHYYNEVKQLFPLCKVIKTESNGRPVKGHNSVINYFHNHTQYDYLIPVDGDDFLYPFALKTLESYMSPPYNPDVCMLPCNDTIGTKWNIHLHCPIQKKCYLNYNIKELNIMKDVYKNLSPFKNSIGSINTPCRIILLSRKALNINIRYDENLRTYDDLIAFCQIFETSQLYPSQYNIYYLDEYNIYLYNKLNTDSCTNICLNIINEQMLFDRAIEKKFLLIKIWNLKLIKVLKNSYDNSIIQDKIKFCYSLVNSLQLPDIDINYQEINNSSKYLDQNNIENIYNIFNIPKYNK